MMWIVMSATGHVASINIDDAATPMSLAATKPRVDDDVIRCAIPAADDGVGVVTADGHAWRLDADKVPPLVPAGPWSLTTAPLLTALAPSSQWGTPVGLYSLALDEPPLALGTLNGTVKRVVPEYKGWDDWDVMRVDDSDRIVGVGQAREADDLVFVSADAQLLRMPARLVRAQGRAAGGMAGISLSEGAHVLFFGVVPSQAKDTSIVATLTTPGEAASTFKTTAFSEYPSKGRATSGVRTHRFLKGQESLRLAWVGPSPARACDAQGAPRNLPSAMDRRDGSGAKVYGPFFALG